MTDAPWRAVLDTSTLYRPSLRRDLQRAAQQRAFVGIWSPWIIWELTHVLTWHWAANVERQEQPNLQPAGPRLTEARRRECATAARSMMELLLATFEMTQPTRPFPFAWPALTDPWDHPIWAAAVESHARFVVSENVRHFPPADSAGRHVYQGIEYMSGGAFLTRLLSR